MPPPPLSKKVEIRAVRERIMVFVLEEGIIEELIAEELMMPILGIVRAKDFKEAVAAAVWLEHGNRHSAHIHSKNVDRITEYARAMDTAILVKNGPKHIISRNILPFII